MGQQTVFPTYNYCGMRWSCLCQNSVCHTYWDRQAHGVGEVQWLPLLLVQPDWCVGGVGCFLAQGRAAARERSGVGLLRLYWVTLTDIRLDTARHVRQYHLNEVCLISDCSILVWVFKQAGVLFITIPFLAVWIGYRSSCPAPVITAAASCGIYLIATSVLQFQVNEPNEQHLDSKEAFY